MTRLDLLTANKGDLFVDNSFGYILLATSDGDGESVDVMLYQPYEDRPHVETVDKKEVSYSCDVFVNVIKKKLTNKDMIMTLFTKNLGENHHDLFYKSTRLKRKSS